MGSEICCVSDVWPGVACVSSGAVRVARCVQVFKLSRGAGGEDQRLQLGRFYSADDGCFYFTFTHAARSMASIQPLP